jgi:hypothetical protein
LVGLVESLQEGEGIDMVAARSNWLARLAVVVLVVLAIILAVLTWQVARVGAALDGLHAQLQARAASGSDEFQSQRAIDSSLVELISLAITPNPGGGATSGVGGSPSAMASSGPSTPSLPAATASAAPTPSLPTAAPSLPGAKPAEFQDLVDAEWAAVFQLQQIRVALTGDEGDPASPSILSALESIANQLERLAPSPTPSASIP